MQALSTFVLCCLLAVSLGLHIERAPGKHAKGNTHKKVEVVNTKPEHHTAQRNTSTEKLEKITGNKQAPSASASASAPAPAAAAQRLTEAKAFTAELETDRAFATGSTIVLGKVLANMGDLYISDSGQFVCMDTDVYVFLWSTVNVAGTATRNALELVMRGGVMKSGPRTSAHAGGISGVSTMLSGLQCLTDTPSAVTVRTAIDAVYTAPYTSFSGFKLSSVEHAVMFSAELAADDTIFPGHRIIFNRVLQNYGGSYSGVHGYFRCPTTGLYAFFVSVHSPDGGTPWSVSSLMVDQRPLMHGPITYPSITGVDSGSSSMLTTLQCTMGQDVYVNTNRSFTFPYNSYGATLSTFSGFRLFSDSDAAAVGFTAVLSANHTFLGPDDNTIIFDRVITNVGAAYVPLVGIFICPDTDVYLFSWTAATTLGGSHIDLFVNNDPVKRNIFSLPSSDYANGSTSGTSTMAAVVQCAVDRQVHVAARFGTDAGTVYLANYSSFSGFKIPIL